MRFSVNNSLLVLGMLGILAGAALLQTRLSASLFSDLPVGHPASPAASYMMGQKFMKGYPDGTFRPESPVNRAEIAKIIAIIAQRKGHQECIPSSASALPSDVPANAWFAPFVCTAQQAGFINGYPDGTFRPAKIVSFVEAAKLIVVSLGGNGLQGDPWYTPYVEALADRNAIPLTINNLEMPLRRSDLAEILYRVFANMTDAPSRSVEEMLTPHGAAPASAPNELAQLLELLNAERTSRGLQPFAYNAILSNAAQNHATDMNARNYYSHTSPEGQGMESRIRAVGYYPSCVNCSILVGENITKASSPEKAVDMWMNSAVHRKNILSTALEEIGLGKAGLYWVNTFGTIKYL